MSEARQQGNRRLGQHSCALFACQSGCAHMGVIEGQHGGVWGGGGVGACTPNNYVNKVQCGALMQIWCDWLCSHF